MTQERKWDIFTSNCQNLGHETHFFAEVTTAAQNEPSRPWDGERGCENSAPLPDLAAARNASPSKPETMLVFMNATLPCLLLMQRCSGLADGAVYSLKLSKLSGYFCVT